MRGKILIPVDITETELTNRLIQTVERECRNNDDEIHFLTVIQSWPYVPALGGRYSPDIPVMDFLREEAKKKLNALVSRFTFPHDNIHLHYAEGKPKDKILEKAKEINADLIIISSHRPDFTTYLLGSNAAFVVRHATCSVLVVR